MFSTSKFFFCLLALTGCVLLCAAQGWGGSGGAPGAPGGSGSGGAPGAPGGGGYGGSGGSGGYGGEGGHGGYPGQPGGHGYGSGATTAYQSIWTYGVILGSLLLLKKVALF